MHRVYDASDGRSTHRMLKKGTEMILRRRIAVPPKLADGSKKINLIVSPEWLKLVEDWGKKQPGFVTRSDAIRKIVEQHLTQDAPGDKPKKVRK